MIIEKKAAIAEDKTIGWILAVIVLALLVGITIFLNPSWIYKLLPQYNQVNNSQDVLITGSDLIVDPCMNDKLILVGKLSTNGRIAVVNFVAKSFELTWINLVQNNTGPVRLDADAPGLCNSVIDVGTFDAKTKVLFIEQYFNTPNTKYAISTINFHNFRDSCFGWTNVDYGFSYDQLKLLDGSVYSAGLFCKDKSLVKTV